MLGLDVLMGFAGQVSLGQAGFMAIGGYTAAILAVTYGVPPLVGTLAGIAVGGGGGVAVARHGAASGALFWRWRRWRSA